MSSTEEDIKPRFSVTKVEKIFYYLTTKIHCLQEDIYKCETTCASPRYWAAAYLICCYPHAKKESRTPLYTKRTCTQKKGRAQPPGETKLACMIHLELWQELIAPHLNWEELLMYGCTCRDARRWVRFGEFPFHHGSCVSVCLRGEESGEESGERSGVGWVWEWQDEEGFVACVPASLPLSSRTVVKIALAVWPDIRLESDYEVKEYLLFRYESSDCLQEVFNIVTIILLHAETFCRLEAEANRWRRRNGIRKLGFTWTPRSPSTASDPS